MLNIMFNILMIILTLSFVVSVIDLIYIYFALVSKKDDYTKNSVRELEEDIDIILVLTIIPVMNVLLFFGIHAILKKKPSAIDISEEKRNQRKKKILEFFTKLK